MKLLSLITLLFTGMLQAQTLTLTLDPGPSQFALPAQVLEGTLNPADAVLSVNGASLSVDANGRFSYPVTLHAGLNSFLFRATKAGLNDAVAKRDLYLDTESPRVIFSSPQADDHIRDTSITITGIVDDAYDAAPSLTRGSSPITLSDRRFIDANLPLSDGANTFTYSATDASGNSQSFTLTVYQRSTPPTVTIAAPQIIAVGTSYTLNISFSPEADIASTRVTVDAEPVATTDNGAPLSLELAQKGTLDSIQVGASATDTYGNTTQVFQTIQIARPHYLFGLVLDDQTSKPLAGIPVLIRAPMGDQTVVTGADGRYQAYASGLPLQIAVTQNAYVPCWRSLDAVAAGQRVTDLRLITRKAALAGGVHDLGALVVTLGGFSGQAQATPFTAQGLPALLPLGYSPVLGFELTNISGSGTIHLEARRLPQLPGQSTLWLLKQDGADWLVQGHYLVPAQALSSTFSGSAGSYVLALVDTWSNAAAPTMGQRLSRSGDRLVDAGALDHLSTYPASVSLLDNPRTSVSMRVASAGRLPSGSRARILARERHERYSDDLVLPAYALDIYTYAYGANDGSKALLADFLVSARHQIDPAATKYAAIAFTGLPGERFEPNFPNAQNQLDLGALTLDLNGVLQPGRVASLMTSDAAPPLSPQSQSVFSFELWLSEPLTGAPAIAFKGTNGQHLILLHQREDQSWVYAGQLTQTANGWSASAGSCNLTEAGTYAFVSLEFPITDVSGQVTAAGTPVVGARVRSSFHSWFGQSDTQGTYRFLVRQNGEGQLIEAQHASSHRSAVLTLPVTQAVSALTQRDFALVETPFNLLYSEPKNGQQYVPRSPQIVLYFDQAPSLDRTHLASQISLGNGIPLQILPDPDGKRLNILPLSVLEPDSDYTLTLQPGLENIWGQTLGQSVTVSFHTLSHVASTGPDLTRFYLDWTNNQLSLHAPDGALPARTFLEVRNSERGFSWSGTWLGGAFDLNVDGEVGQAIELIAKTPDGRSYKHRVTLTRLAANRYLLGSSPFHLDLGDNVALDVDRITSGFGSQVQIEVVPAEISSTTLAQVPIMASAPAFTPLAGLRFTAVEDLPLPELLGRITVPLPEGDQLQSISLLELAEHVNTPTSLEDPTLVERTFAYVHDLVSLNEGEIVQEPGKLRKTSTAGLQLAFSLEEPQTAQFAVFQTLHPIQKIDANQWVNAVIWTFREDKNNPTSDGDPLSGVTVFAPSNGTLVPVGSTRKGKGHFYWYGSAGPIKGIDPATFAVKKARMGGSTEITGVFGSHIRDDINAFLSFPPLKPGTDEYDPQVELKIEVGKLKDGAFELDQALMARLNERHAIEVSNNPLQKVRLVATSKNTEEGFTAELATTFNGSAVIQGRQEGPNRLIYDLPNISQSSGFYHFILYLPTRAKPLGEVSTTLLVEDTSNPGQDVVGNPEVSFWEPSNNSKDVAITPRIYLRFSEPVNQLESAIAFNQGDTPAEFALIAADGRPIDDGDFVSEVIILPNAALRYKTEYTLTIQGAVDQSGNSLQVKGEDKPFETLFTTRPFPDPDALEREENNKATASLRNLLLTLSGSSTSAGFELNLYDLRDPEQPEKRYTTPKNLGHHPGTVFYMRIFAPELMRADDQIWSKPSIESQPLEGLQEGTIVAIASHYWELNIQRLTLLRWAGGSFKVLTEHRIYQRGVLRCADQLGPYFFMAFRDVFDDGGGVTVAYDVRKLLQKIKESAEDTNPYALSEMPPSAAYPMPSKAWDITPFLRKDNNTYKPTLLIGGEEYPGMLHFDPKKRPYFEDMNERDGRELTPLEWPSGDWLTKSRVGRWNNYTGVAEQLFYHKNEQLVSEDFAIFSESDRAASGNGYIYVFPVPQEQDAEKDEEGGPRLIIVLPGGLKNMTVDRSSGLIAIQDQHHLLNVLDLRTALENTTEGEVLTLEVPHPYFLLEESISTTFSLQMKFHDGWLIGIEHGDNDQIIRPIPINPRRYRTQGWELLDVESASYARDGIVDTSIRIAKQMVLYASDWALADERPGKKEEQADFSLEMGSYVVDLYGGEELTIQLFDSAGEPLGDEEIRKSKGNTRQIFSLVDLADYFTNTEHQADLRKKGFLPFKLKISIERDDVPVLEDTAHFIMAYLPDMNRTVDPNRQAAGMDTLSQRPNFRETDQSMSSRDSRMALDVDRQYSDLYSWQVNPYGPGMADAAQLQLGCPVFWRPDQLTDVPQGDKANPLLLFDLPGEFMYYFIKKGSNWKCFGDLQSTFAKDPKGYTLTNRKEIDYKLENFKALDFVNYFNGLNTGVSGEENRRKVRYPVLRYPRAANVPYALLSGARVESMDRPWKNSLRFLAEDQISSVPDTIKEHVKDSGQDRKITRTYTATELGALIEENSSEPNNSRQHYNYDEEGYLVEVTHNGHFPRKYEWEDIPGVPELGDFIPKRLIRVEQDNWYRGFAYSSENPTRLEAIESPFGTQSINAEFDDEGRLNAYILRGIGGTPDWMTTFEDTAGSWLSSSYGPFSGDNKVGLNTTTWKSISTDEGSINLIETDSFGDQSFTYDDHGRMTERTRKGDTESWDYENEDDFFNIATRYTKPSEDANKAGNAMIFKVDSEGLSFYPENEDADDDEDIPTKNRSPYTLFGTPLNQIIGEPLEQLKRSKKEEEDPETAIILKYSDSGVFKSISKHGQAETGGKDSENYVPSQGDFEVKDDRIIEEKYPGTQMTKVSREYDDVGNLIEVNRSGVIQQFSDFDDLGRPSQVSFPGQPDLNYSITYTYEDDLFFVTHTETTGNTMATGYDALGRKVVERRDWMGTTSNHHYTYDDLNRLTEVTNKGNSIYKAEYFEDTQSATLEEFPEYKVEYEVVYDRSIPTYESKTITEKHSQREWKAHYKTDIFGRVIETEEAGLGHVAYEYDSWGRLSKVVDPETREVFRKYLYPNAQKATIVKDMINQVAKVSVVKDKAGFITVSGYYSKNHELPMVMHTTTVQQNGEQPDTFTTRSKSQGELVQEREISALGYMLKLRDNDLMTEALDFDGRGRPIEFGGDFKSEYVYESNGNLKQLTNPKGYVFKVLATDNGRLSSWTSPRGQTTELTFDGPDDQTPSMKRVDSVVLYNREGNKDQHFTTLGAETAVKTQIIAGTRFVETSVPAIGNAPSGTATEAWLRPSGLMETQTDMNGTRSDLAYDRYGRLSGDQTIEGIDYLVTPPAVGTQKTAANDYWEYTPVGGESTRVKYDPMGNILSFSYGNAKTTYSYDKDQRLVEVNDGLTGRIITYSYKSLSRQITSIKGLEEPIAYSDFDRGFAKKAIIGPQATPMVEYEITYHSEHPGVPDSQKQTLSGGRITNSEFDEFGQVTKIQAPYLEPVSYEYNKWGMPSKMTIGEAGTVIALFDERNNLTWNLDPAVTLTVDQANRLDTVAMASMDPISYHYGASGRPSSVEYGGNTQYAFTYDGNLLETLTTDGQQVWTYSYDKNQRITEIEDNQRANPLAVYTYTPEDRILTYTDTNEVTQTYSYDKHGNIAKIDITHGPSLDFAFHDNGDLRRVSSGAMTAEFNGFQHGLPASFSWIFEGNTLENFTVGQEDGRLESISSNDFLLELEWMQADSGSPLISQIKKGGPGYDETWDVQYTEDMKLDDITITRANGDIITEAYETTSKGLPTKLIRTLNGNILLDSTLSSSTEGVRTDVMDGALVNYDTRGSISSLINASDQGRTENYTFNGHRQFVQMELQRQGTQPAKDFFYDYDHEGHRITSTDNLTLNETVYAWQGSRVIAIGLQSQLGIQWTHALGYGPLGPVFIEDLEGDNDYFIFTDHLGTPFAYQNPHTEKVYYTPTSPWGELMAQDSAHPSPWDEGNLDIPMVTPEATEAEPNPQPFPLFALPPDAVFGLPPLGLAGHLRDASTGLIQMHHRTFHPRLGLFLTPDFRAPDIYDPSTFKEPYAYAAGNPIMFWDPDGLKIDESLVMNNERWKAIKASILATELGLKLWNELDAHEAIFLISLEDLHKSLFGKVDYDIDANGKFIGATIRLEESFINTNSMSRAEVTGDYINNIDFEDNFLNKVASVVHELGHVAQKIREPDTLTWKAENIRIGKIRVQMAAYLDAKYIKTSTPKGSSRAERELIDQGNRDMNLQRINEKAAMSLAAGIRPGYDKEEVLFKFTSEQYAIGVSNPIGTQLKKHPDRRKLKKRYSNAPN